MPFPIASHTKKNAVTLIETTGNRKRGEKTSKKEGNTCTYNQIQQRGTGYTRIKHKCSPDLWCCVRRALVVLWRHHIGFQSEIYKRTATETLIRKPHWQLFVGLTFESPPNLVKVGRVRVNMWVHRHVMVLHMCAVHGVMLWIGWSFIRRRNCLVMSVMTNRWCRVGVWSLRQPWCALLGHTLGNGTGRCWRPRMACLSLLRLLKHKL